MVLFNILLLNLLVVDWFLVNVIGLVCVLFGNVFVLFRNKWLMLFLLRVLVLFGWIIIVILVKVML